jgi:uncharacterized lipoprotein YajG
LFFLLYIFADKLTKKTKQKMKKLFFILAVSVALISCGTSNEETTTANDSTCVAPTCDSVCVDSIVVVENTDSVAIVK